MVVNKFRAALHLVPCVLSKVVDSQSSPERNKSDFSSKCHHLLNISKNTGHILFCFTTAKDETKSYELCTTAAAKKMLALLLLNIFTHWQTQTSQEKGVLSCV
jgi:hypothetical protein